MTNERDLTAEEIAELVRLLPHYRMDHESSMMLIRLAPQLLAMAARTVEAERNAAELREAAVMKRYFDAHRLLDSGEVAIVLAKADAECGWRALLNAVERRLGAELDDHTRQAILDIVNLTLNPIADRIAELEHQLAEAKAKVRQLAADAARYRTDTLMIAAEHLNDAPSGLSLDRSIAAAAALLGPQS